MITSTGTIEFSEKQFEAIVNAPGKRWDFKVGAVRTGKTTVDFKFIVPDAIRRLRGKKGLCVICGVAQNTINRNFLIPMQQEWGTELVSEVKKDATGQTYVMLFGEVFYLFGAEKKNAINKIQGMSVKLCIGDEVAKWAKEFFDFIKNRLDLEYSEFHGSLNPESTTHYLHEFLEDIKDNDNAFIQYYTLFDNPFLSPKFVKALCEEYASSQVLYNRYILGKWERAEGIIFKPLADAPKEFECEYSPEDGHIYRKYDNADMGELNFIHLGVDFGGNQSKHSFVATGYTVGYKYVAVLESRRIETGITPTELEAKFVNFAREVEERYYNAYIKSSRFDNAETTLIDGMKVAVGEAGLPFPVKNALKHLIVDRIRLILRLMGIRRIGWTVNARTSRDAYATAVWDPDKTKEDVRLDDGTCDVDSQDSTEYTIEIEKKALIATLGGNIDELGE